MHRLMLFSHVSILERPERKITGWSLRVRVILRENIMTLREFLLTNYIMSRYRSAPI